MVYRTEEDQKKLEEGQEVWMCRFMAGCIYLTQKPVLGIVKHKIYGDELKTYSTILIQHKDNEKKLQHISNVVLSDTYEECVEEYNWQIKCSASKLRMEADEIEKELIL